MNQSVCIVPREDLVGALDASEDRRRLGNKDYYNDWAQAYCDQSDYKEALLKFKEDNGFEAYFDLLMYVTQNHR